MSLLSGSLVAGGRQELRETAQDSAEGTAPGRLVRYRTGDHFGPAPEAADARHYAFQFDDQKVTTCSVPPFPATKRESRPGGRIAQSASGA
jgi:hypothetical protein